MRQRAAYFREYRKMNQEALRAYWRERARRAYVKKPRLRVRAPAEINPELASLIREQERDGRRYQIKNDPGGFVFDDERFAA